MDSEEAAFASAKEKHNKYILYGKKNRYIEVFQCSGDDMNLVLNGGVHSPVNQRKSSPLLSHGMLASQQQQQSQPQVNATATQSLPSGLTLPQPLALSNLSITRPHASSANAALIAQQQAQLIAQQSLLARQQAAAASVNHHQNESHSQYFMPNFLIPASAANAVVQSSLMPQTNHHHAIHVSTANTAQLQTTQAFQSPLTHTTHPPFLYMQRATNIPSATMPTALQSTATIPFGGGIPSNIQNIPFQTHPSIPFVNPYTNQVLLSPHSFSAAAAAHNNSLAALHLRSPQQAQHTHHLQSNLNNQLSYANQYLQSTIPKPILASPNSYQLPNHLTVNTNAATATSLMHAASFKRSYESAFHQDPSASIHHQKRPTQFTGTGIL